MQITTVPLSSLLSPKGNPRRQLDPADIAQLAQSIRSDGVLQNLVVRPDGEEKFRVVSGKRRYLALQALKKEAVIDGSYQVPVEIRDDLTDHDALRLATVENVQRVELHVMDEAEAFAKLLQTGGTIEAIADRSGLSSQTIKRRLALANLCSEAKKALRAGDITRSVAEALTLAPHGQQRQLLESVDGETNLDADEIRAMLLERKPSLAMARFPKEKYSGGFTTDLFADEETTYFDDVDQFLTLQKQAVEAMAEEQRKSAAWVEVLSLYAVPWWQYREAEAGEPSGVVINLHPLGEVEVRTGLMRQPVNEKVATETQETPVAPSRRQRPEFSAPLLRHLACHKSAAVQAALLRNPRKAREVAALLLLCGSSLGYGVRLAPHACHEVTTGLDDAKSYAELRELTAWFSGRLGRTNEAGKNGGSIAGLVSEIAWEVTYEGLSRLADDELDRLIVLLPVLCFGQEGVEAIDGGDSFFNRVALDLGVNLRDWWTPDVAFLSALRREQLLAVADGSGAGLRFSNIRDWSKTELVQGLVRFFESAKTSEDEASLKARQWLPGILQFPASQDLAVKTE